MKKLFLMIFTISLLTGCGEEETHTVDYYQSHPDLMQEKIKDCKNNPGELADTPNCINAERAARLIKLEKKRKEILQRTNKQKEYLNN